MSARPNEIAQQQPALSPTTKALWLAAMQRRRRADALAKSGEAERSPVIRPRAFRIAKFAGTAILIVIALDLVATAATLAIGYKVMKR